MTSRRLIRIKVLQLLYAYYKKEGASLAEAERDLLKSIEKSTDLYYQILLLLSELQRKAFLKIDAAKNRHFVTEADLHPNTRFIDNPVFLSSIIIKSSEHTYSIIRFPGTKTRKLSISSTTPYRNFRPIRLIWKNRKSTFRTTNN